MSELRTTRTTRLHRSTLNGNKKAGGYLSSNQLGEVPFVDDPLTKSIDRKFDELIEIMKSLVEYLNNPTNAAEFRRRFHLDS